MKWHDDTAQLSRQRGESAVGGAQGKEGFRGNKKSEHKPNHGSAGRGGNRRGRKETVVDESKKEMVDTVARHQVDY